MPSVLPAGRDAVTSDSTTGIIGSGIKVPAAQVTGLSASTVGALPSNATITINGTQYTLSSNPSITVASSGTSAVAIAYWNSSDTSWYTAPAGGGAKLTARPAGVTQVQFQGQPATTSLPSWATTADLRIDAA